MLVLYVGYAATEEYDRMTCDGSGYDGVCWDEDMGKDGVSLDAVVELFFPE